MRYSTYISFAAAISIVCFAATLPSQADEVTVKRTTVITPGTAEIVVPERMFGPVTTVTRRTVVETPVVVESPIVVPLEHNVITNEAFVAAPLPTTTTTTKRTTVIESTNRPLIQLSSLPPAPLFSKRLAYMADQINMSLAKDWITVSQADFLRAEHDRIAAMIISRGPTVAESDAIETRLNLLNLAIQDDLNSNLKTAGIGHLY